MTGLASSESAATSVSLKDSATPANLRTTTPDASGNFSIDATGLTAPFYLKAETASGPEYAIALSSGRSDVNPITTAACAGASKDEDDEDGEEGWSGRDHDSKTRSRASCKSLRTALKPLFDLYGIKKIGGDDDDHKGSNLRALLRDVRFTVKKGLVTVTNRASGAVIFTGPLRHLSEGTFYPENMPAGPGGGVTCTEFTYSRLRDLPGRRHADPHRPDLDPDGLHRRRTGPLAVVHLTFRRHQRLHVVHVFGLRRLPAEQHPDAHRADLLPDGLHGRYAVLSQACTYVPPVNVCTSFTYSAFGACQSNNTQTRTVLTSSPTGCTGGSPVLTQACTYVPPRSRALRSRTRRSAPASRTTPRRAPC